VVKKVNVALEALACEFADGNSEKVNLICYGLAFKPDVDDLRESPAVQIVRSLADTHAGQILVVEPNIKMLPDELKDIKLTSLKEATQSSGIHVMLVDHREFKSKQKPDGIVIDVRGIWV
jgi:UDP-N-acetyl-D-mannosaminuronic acid dehydrogenase